MKKRRIVAKVSAILKKLDLAVTRSKPKHGPMPTFITRSQADTSEWAWLTAPERAHRFYDSSLSTPGRICHRHYCHHFVAGPSDRPCPNCGGLE